MAAAVIAQPRQLHITHIALPQPGPEQVRVRIEGCGVCGSNVPPWEGRDWFNYPMPPGHLGHEGWGRVDAVGSDVAEVVEGQRVAFISHHAYAEYDIVNAAEVVPLPPALDGQPFPGEPLACAINVFRRSDVRAGQTVAIIGIGFLGAVLTQLCRNAGATVIAVSRREYALEVARHMGAQHTVQLGEGQAWQALENVKQITGGKLVPRVIEAAGKQETLDLAAELCDEYARLIIAGYHQDGPRQVNMQLWNWRGLDVINAHERDPRKYLEGIRLAIDAVVSGRLDASPLYTNRYRLDQLDRALEATRLRPDGFMKALIMMPAPGTPGSEGQR